MCGLLCVSDDILTTMISSRDKCEAVAIADAFTVWLARRLLEHSIRGACVLCPEWVSSCRVLHVSFQRMSDDFRPQGIHQISSHKRFPTLCSCCQVNRVRSLQSWCLAKNFAFCRVDGWVREFARSYVTVRHSFQMLNLDHRQEESLLSPLAGLRFKKRSSVLTSN